MSDNNLTIMNELFNKEGSEEQVEGLTIMVDGVIKQVFDKIKADKNYDTYNEVLRDVIFEGINSIVKK
ncbi:hypothetical protein ACYSNR_00490 [Enterococcus sp. LJL128]|uniref:hypothetical protein n=1 Tax=Enterococcus sp. LJL51 TaxID=3416656 RepID=UPI003CF03190